jgi:dihydroorotase
MNLLLKNARIVDPLTKRDEAGLDIEIRDGRIAKIGKGLTASNGVDVRDLNGAVVAPGFFDMHVHLREPGQEYKETIETGLAAAAAGGFTGICCMPNTDPPISDPFVVAYIKEKSKDHLVDLEICGTMTKGRKGEELAPMEALAKSGVRMISDDGSALASAEMMRRVLEYAKMFDLLVTQHCEEHTMTVRAPMNEGRVSAKLGLTGWPSVAEDLIVSRDTLLTNYVGGVRYHVAHMSTAESVRIVREAKARGIQVTSEVTPHHFLLTEEAVEEFGTMAKMNPPLRTSEDIEAIKQGLKDGTIDCISTDHAPHASHEKETDIVTAAFGIIGLETAVAIGLTALVSTGILSLPHYIEKCSTNPRKCLKLEPVRIEEGASANLTVLDPDVEWTFTQNDIRSKSHNTPFVGRRFRGRALGAINRGQAWWNPAV